MLTSCDGFARNPTVADIAPRATLTRQTEKADVSLLDERAHLRPSSTKWRLPTNETVPRARARQADQATLQRSEVSFPVL